MSSTTTNNNNKELEINDLPMVENSAMGPDSYGPKRSSSREQFIHKEHETRHNSDVDLNEKAHPFDSLRRMAEVH